MTKCLGSRKRDSKRDLSLNAFATTTTTDTDDNSSPMLPLPIIILNNNGSNKYKNEKIYSDDNDNNHSNIDDKEVSPIILQFMATWVINGRDKKESQKLILETFYFFLILIFLLKLSKILKGPSS